MDDKTPAATIDWRNAPLQAKGKNLEPLSFVRRLSSVLRHP
jgi:hypothetical protein